MGLKGGLKKVVEVALGQVTQTGNNPDTQEIYFTDNFQKKAREWKLSEKDALDVYYHGQERKPGYENITAMNLGSIMVKAKPDRNISQRSGARHGDNFVPLRE
jgi:hypothetical protein